MLLMLVLFSRILLLPFLASCTFYQVDCDALDSACNPLRLNLLYGFRSSASICSAAYHELILPSAWPQVQAELRAQAAKGNYGSPSATLFGPSPGVGSAYVGGVLAPNGIIYAIPHSATSVARIDPRSNTVTFFGSLAGTTKWAGGVLASNGKIYAFPFGATTTSVLVIDPASDSVYQFGAVSAVADKWAGGVLASDGLIYGMATSETAVLAIDPQSDSLTAWGSLTGKSGAVLAPTGKIYAFPVTGGAPYAAVDPDARTVTAFGAAPAGATPFLGGALAPNGKIYALPAIGSAYSEIDPATHAVVDFGSPPAGVGGFVGGVLAPDGKIYGIPNGSGGTYVALDPDSLQAPTFGTIAGGDLYQSGVLAPNGKIYGIPFNAGSFLEIDPRANGTLCPAILQSAYLNKF